MGFIHDLAEYLKKAPDEVFLQPHNVPDPDAIAASFGLQVLLDKLGVKSDIVYEMEIEKANSKKMLEAFGITMRPASSVETLGAEDWTVLVDVQKTNSNVTDLVTEEVACIDHHQDNGFDDYVMRDVRPQVGATSSIVAQYWEDTGLLPPPNVATALIYGILMDTDGLVRGVDTLDIDQFYRLYGYADMAKINELNANKIALSTLKNYAAAFETVEVYGTIGFLRLESEDDSLLGSASDIVLTVAGVDIVVAYAVRRSGLKYSTRSVDPFIDAADLVRHLVAGIGIGGGHASMAGGFIPLDSLPIQRSPDTFTRIRAIDFVERDSVSGRR